MTATDQIDTWLTPEAIATIGGAATALLAFLVKMVPQVRVVWKRLVEVVRRVDNGVSAKLELEASLRAIRRVALIRAMLREWVPRKGSQRGLLLTANNGGKAWKEGGPLFVSNPAQIAGPGNPNTENLWQGWKADQWYVECLHTLLSTYKARRGLLIVTKNDVQGELRHQYERQGTVASVILPFHWNQGGVLWYVSLNFGCIEFGETAEGHIPAISDEEARPYVQAAERLYADAAKCRLLIRELSAAWKSHAE